MPDVNTFGGIGAILAALGAGGFINEWYKRRSANADKREEKAERAESEATAANTKTLELLLDNLKSQMASYELQLADMRLRMAEQERKIHDLELTNRRYEAGQIVAPGYALVPVPHLAEVRKRHPGVLPLNDYPGESGVAAVLPITSNRERQSEQ